MMIFPYTAFMSPGSGELLMIMLVLIMLFGSRDAVRILRKVQDVLRRLRFAAADFQYALMHSDAPDPHDSATPVEHRTGETAEEDVYDLDSDDNSKATAVKDDRHGQTVDM